MVTFSTNIKFKRKIYKFVPTWVYLYELNNTMKSVLTIVNILSGKFLESCDVYVKVIKSNFVTEKKIWNMTIFFWRTQLRSWIWKKAILRNIIIVYNMSRNQSKSYLILVAILIWLLSTFSSSYADNHAIESSMIEGPNSNNGIYPKNFPLTKVSDNYIDKWKKFINLQCGFIIENVIVWFSSFIHFTTLGKWYVTFLNIFLY